MLIGLALIWWNLRRPKEVNLKASAQNGDIPPGTIVSLDGSCDFKIDGKSFECESKLAYGHFTNGRTQINVLPKILGAVAFSGGKDLQLKPEYSNLSSRQIRSLRPYLISKVQLNILQPYALKLQRVLAEARLILRGAM
jgi:hypothetical protein